MTLVGKDKPRFFGAKFWRTAGQPGEVPDEVEEWIVLVKSVDKDLAAGVATALAQRHDLTAANNGGTEVIVRNLDYVQDHGQDEPVDYMDDYEGENDHEVFGQLFEFDDLDIAWRDPYNDLTEGGEIDGQPPLVHRTDRTPRFFTVKAWKTWAYAGSPVDELELSVVLELANSAEEAARQAEARIKSIDYDFISIGGPVEVRFLTITNVYDTGTDNLNDLVDGSRPVYAERFPLDEWGPVGFSPLANLPGR
jgi:hypothetical protein